MHYGRTGREFIHGLTRERDSRPKELHANQTDQFQNWAVGIYNDKGGYIIGQVWKDHNSPSQDGVSFPVGTVGIKLLFTAATSDQVPFLQNSKEWQANINTSLHVTDRAAQTVRLLQIDVAVRDQRANTTTGWVFGTFIYNGAAQGASPLDRMVPVGLMWGNDPDVTPSDVQSERKKIVETILNPDARPLMKHYGWAGRLNGPVDNPISS